MHEGIELDIDVGGANENDDFIAVAAGNVASFSLARERGENLQWQILRLEGSGKHHFRLVLRHPDRTLDIGLKHMLEKKLRAVSAMDIAELRSEFEKCRKNGMQPSKLRHVKESADTWNDDFWNWIG